VELEIKDKKSIQPKKYVPIISKVSFLGNLVQHEAIPTKKAWFGSWFSLHP